MICKNCGKENDEGVMNCVECGAVLEEVTDEAVSEAAFEENAEEGTVADFYTADGSEVPCECGCECCCGEGEENVKKSGIGKVLAIAIPAVVIVGAAVAAFAFGVFTHPAIKAQKAYYNALASGDGETIYKYDVDKYELVDAQKGLGAESESDVIKIYKENFEQYPEMFRENLGNKIKADVYVADVHKYSKEDIKKLDEHLVKYCGYAEGALQDIRVMDVLVTIGGDKDDLRNYIEEIAAKVDGKWYVGAVGDIYDDGVIEDILSGEYDRQQEEKNNAPTEDDGSDNGSEEADSTTEE